MFEHVGRFKRAEQSTSRPRTEVPKQGNQQIKNLWLQCSQRPLHRRDAPQQLHPLRARSHPPRQVRLLPPQGRCAPVDRATGCSCRRAAPGAEWSLSPGTSSCRPATSCRGAIVITGEARVSHGCHRVCLRSLESSEGSRWCPCVHYPIIPASSLCERLHVM